MRSKTVASVIAGALLFGAMATIPAQAAPDVKGASGKTTATLSTYNVYIPYAYSGSGDTRIANVALDVPDDYVYVWKYGIVKTAEVQWTVKTSMSGTACSGSNSVKGSGDGIATAYMRVYQEKEVGTCHISAFITAYRAVEDHPGAYVNEQFTIKNTFTFTTSTKTSIKAPKTVKKGKTAKLSGKTKAHIGSKKSTRDLRSNDKVQIQAKVKGKWKTVKTVKTSKNGNWSYKVKPKKSTTYRAVHVKSKYYGKSTSKAVTVKVKK